MYKNILEIFVKMIKNAGGAYFLGKSLAFMVPDS